MVTVVAVMTVASVLQYTRSTECAESSGSVMEGKMYTQIGKPVGGERTVSR